MTLVTIPNVEICSTGSWNASTGPVTFTEQDLQAALAAVDDPAVKEPRLVIGHTDGTAGPSMSGQDDGFFGEQPALGRYTNLRLGANGQTLVGDLVGVPSWLADILPTAYPNRSIEGYWDVTSATGKEHSFIIPRVAVLGVSLPAVATLKDLQAMYSEDGPEGVTLTKVGERVAASKGAEPPKKVAASVQFEDVRREFYDSFATADDDRYWWWIRAVYVDPPILIADDDEGGLYAVPYSVAGDTTEFGEPTQVVTQFVEKDSGKVAAARPDAPQKYTKAESRPDNRTRTKESPKMARVTASIDVSALRSRLGLTTEQLPDDATEDQINSALVGGTSPDPAPPDTGDGFAPTPGTPESGAITPDNPEGGQGIIAPAGTPDSARASGAVIDAETLAQLQRDAAMGREARASQIQTERTSIVSAAVADGRIPPSRRDHYLTLMSRDDTGTRDFLATLTPGVAVPTGEVGGDDGGGVAASNTEYIDTHLSQSERDRIALAREGSTTNDRIITEA